LKLAAGHTALFLPLSSDQVLLRRILARSDHPDVRLLDGSYRKVTAREACLMIRNVEWEWCGSKNRVRKMRPLKPRPIWVACYRTTAAATLPPSIEWCWNLR
jgi:hypothetical protein